MSYRYAVIGMIMMLASENGVRFTYPQFGNEPAPVPVNLGSVEEGPCRIVTL